MAAINKRNALGRGLDALIDMGEIETSGTSSINEIELSRIQPNPDQPRREFDDESLEELAASIREIGIVQPISLRQQPNGSYQIIAGERRYRAARLAGLATIPAYIRTVEDEAAMEMALIENIQREDLNAIEIALSFKKLIEQYNLTQEQLSERVGKKRTTVANYLRLLKLPAEVQIGLRDKTIDMGHARAILGSSSPEQQLTIYKKILLNGLSVRKVEELVSATKPQTTATKKEPAYTEQQDILSKALNMPVKITNHKLTISFKSEEELQRIISQLV
jgi:ParB family chromosome partitioning protein